jgi:hypothetical protein
MHSEVFSYSRLRWSERSLWVSLTNQHKDRSFTQGGGRQCPLGKAFVCQHTVIYETAPAASTTTA